MVFSRDGQYLYVSENAGGPPVITALDGNSLNFIGQVPDQGQEILKTIPTIEERMRKIDPRAFDDPNNWWPVIIEQMNQGLL